MSGKTIKTISRGLVCGMGLLMGLLMNQYLRDATVVFIVGGLPYYVLAFG